jgi:xanthine dehydrogenase accessory factor
LPIGAKTPAEIAVSIVAEVIAAIRVEGLSASALDSHLPAESVDPVCGMLVVVGPTAQHLRIADADHWFCSAACRASFAAARADA